MDVVQSASQWAWAALQGVKDWALAAPVEAAFALAALGFIALEALRPRFRKRFLRNGLLTDWLCAANAGIIADRITAVSIAGLTAAAVATFGPVRFQWASTWPLLVQIPVFLVLADFVTYWEHRAFHYFDCLWAFHKVHHSSTQLDWLSNWRAHAADVVLPTLCAYVALTPLGFSLETLGWVAAIDVLDGGWAHSNLRPRLRALRYAIITPETHRWHHVSAVGGDAEDQPPQIVNYAMMFPFYDMLFGTYFSPAMRCPERFGVPGDPRYAEYGFLRLQIQPFIDAFHDLKGKLRPRGSNASVQEA